MDNPNHSLTRSYPRESVRRAAVLSDGATRPVDQMGLYKWPAYLDLLDKLGVAGLIDHVRSIEIADPHGEVHPRTKTHDDATAAYAPTLRSADAADGPSTFAADDARSR
jgi:hypothetical protein